MTRCIALATFLSLAIACSTAPKTEWQPGDGGGDPEVIREQRAKDLADCATLVGAPTYGVQSTTSLSREQTRDCMHAKGWRMVPASEP